jgi:S2P endopeptidase
MLLSFVLHELGHALATVHVGKEVESAGLFFICIMPGAFVRLRGDVYTDLTKLDQLKIVCGGVWHNAVLCGVTAMALANLKLLLTPFYADGNAVVVNISPWSPLSAHLETGDHIISLNNDELHSSADWDRRLLAHPSSYQDGARGVCWEVNVVLHHHGARLECCMQNTVEKQFDGDACFSYMDAGNTDSFCAPASAVDAGASTLCRSNDDCPAEAGACCVQPAAAGATNTIQVALSIRSSEGKVRVVHYMGNTEELRTLVQLTDLMPRFTFGSTQFLACALAIPALVEYATKLLFQASMSLLVINSLPVPAVDGFAILKIIRS